MTEQAWYRKTLLIVTAVILALLIVALAIGLYEARPPEPVQINHITKVEYVVNTETVIREVSEIDWQPFTVTAYTAQDAGCNNITSIGVNYDKSWTEYFEFVAVDPAVIPYGSTVFIKHNGDIVEALAVDTGGRIKGKRLDWYKESLDEAYSFGVQELEVGIIESKEV